MLHKSAISKIDIKEGESVCGIDIREEVFTFIHSIHPEFSRDKHLTLEELNHFRRLYLTHLIEEDKGDIARIDKIVLNAIRNNAILSENIVEIQDDTLTFGQKMADKIAYFGGSWSFILAFFFFIFVWIIINIIALFKTPFDPYPFILLNLILSCLASLQAPIIMMSQNRQEQKDRERSEHDYKINLKAELEIQLLSEKIDHLIIHQNKKLLEIQQLQTDYLEDMMTKLGKK